ncbi:MAG: diguanylate cyclase [Erysipelotrichaceae bacterium]
MENLPFIEITESELVLFRQFISLPMVLFNEEKVFSVNEGFYGVCGTRDHELLNLKFKSIMSDEHTVLAVRESFRTGQPTHFEVELIREDQEKMHLEISGKPVLYQGIPVLLAFLTDITEVKKTQEDLLRVSKLRMLMLEVTQSVLETEDLDMFFHLILSNALKALSNGSLGTILVKERTHFSVASFVGFSEDILDFRLPIEDSFLYRTTQGRMDRIVNIPDLLEIDSYYMNRTIFGEEKFIKSTITAPINIKGSLFGIISIDAIDVNAFDEDDVRSMEFIKNTIEIALTNHLSYKEKAFLARYDRLTNLYNRTYFEDQFGLVRDHALRYGESFNLVMFDVDNLKKINDTYGHLVGDRVLQTIAQELESNTRSSDFIARFGGDEFVGIFYHTDVLKLDEKFQKLLAKMTEDPLMVSSHEIICSFSYGISTFPDDGKSMNELIKIADEALYECKAKHRKLFAHP